MDAILYNKVETEADRIIDLIGGFPLGVTKAIKNFSFFICNDNNYPYSLPHDLILDFSKATNLPSNNNYTLSLIGLMGAGWSDNGVRKIEIITQPGRYIILQNAFSNQQYITEVIFTNGAKTSGDFSQTFSNCSQLKTISGEIDTSISWVNNPFESCINLENVCFAKNCIGKTSANNLSMYACSKLTNDSLISIANGLYEGAGKTLTLHATPKAACSTIMGTVSTDSENNYHIFTADASGSATLADFITNTKGWTLA